MPAWGWGLALWARAVPWTRCQGGVAMAECSWAHLKLSGCQPSTRQGARDMCEAGKAREACSGRTQKGSHWRVSAACRRCIKQEGVHMRR